MATSSAWPGCPSGKAARPKEVVSLGLEDWHACPHRIAYLGRPILDCGHGDDACDAKHRLEIHPPHVITLELHQKTIAEEGASCPKSAPCASAAPSVGCTQGIVSAAFGWANAMIGSHLEFDFWPPPRASPESILCVVGPERDESESTTDAAGVNIVKGLGFRVLKAPSPPPCGAHPDAPAPSLRCTQVPIADPNHVHCVYEDPAAEQCDDE